MRSIHIKGINYSSLKTYFRLKKLKIKTTISDIKSKEKIKKKYNLNKFDKNFFFKSHPKILLNKANKIIISTGVINSSVKLKEYEKSKKCTSEIDLFYKLFSWPADKILMVTGSRGKSTICKKIYYILKKKNLFKKVFYLDRKKLTFFDIPNYKLGYFLIIESDYQNLLLLKSMRAKYRIFSSYFLSENKVFKENTLYKKSKMNIFKNLKYNDNVIIGEKVIKKIHLKINSLKKNIITFEDKNSIDKTNKEIVCLFKNLIYKDLSAKF